jgi:two-component system sensor histidine kinase KdpD
VVAGTPIWTKDTAQGVLCVLKQHPAELGDEERQLLSTIGRQLAVMIDNARLSEKAAENELLRELDRLRSELVANVSHELRTPLGLIMIACTTLLREDIQFDNRTQRSFLNDIVAEANRLERIVDNLLDLSRLQSGKMRLKRQPTELRTLSEQTLETMQSQFAEHRFVSDFPPDGVVANVDSRLIEQVLRNLLGNAGKYSPSGTPITIHGEELEQEILIAVSDRGVGIPAHDLERIFERFYRVQRDDEVEASGIGLGLAVCRGIIEAHGGRIWVESEVGEGSTFYFTLPFTAVETQASGHTRAEHPGQALAEPRSGDR